MSKIILSGVRPTGSIHLGNYLGAIKNWVSLCDEADETLFCIVDQHALTTAADAKDLKENTRLIAAAYVACGIDPDKSFIFPQSHVTFTTELAWYFSCMTPLGWLNRMTQFKEKAGKHRESANLGLYAYPVLMAADVLLYKATHVPVGDDQKQHIELTRDIAQVFNNYVEQEYFTLPEPVIAKESARVMSLRDGTSKMSKSDASDYSRIHLTDSNDDIVQKIKKAKTDSDALPGHIEGLKNRPEAKNLLEIYATLSEQSLAQVCRHFEGQVFSVLKNDLSQLLVEVIAPIRSKIEVLMNDHVELDRIFERGANRANERASVTMNEVRALLNFYPRVISAS